MSHRDDCPDRWEARREGERAFERGYGRNPYEPDMWGERGCEEAADEWKRGHRSAELREGDRRRAE